MTGEKHLRQHHEHDESRRTGGEGDKQAGEDAMADVAKHARSRDRRHIAAIAHHDGDKGLAGQADGAHDAVSDHRRARHVTGIL